MKTENALITSIKKVLVDLEESINQLNDEYHKEANRVFSAKESIFNKAKNNQLIDAQREQDELESLVASDKTSYIKVSLNSLMNAYNVIQSELKEMKRKE